ncbi:MAG: hypothetical protein IJ086_15480 [Clostridium sp.]|nr:hypothetical protein [Clostridium sp.]
MKIKKNIAKTLIFSILFSNISIESLGINQELTSLAGGNIKSVMQKSTVGTWERNLATMPVAAQNFESVEVNGKIYCIGGKNSTSSYLSNMQIYDTKTNTWSTGASMTTGRNNFAAVAVGKYIYCMGGYTSSGRTSSIEIYNTETNTWSISTTSLADSLYGHSAVSVGKKIYLTGGYSSTYNKTMRILDTETNIWSTGANMSYAHEYFDMVEANNVIYCIGGNNAYVEAYNISTNTWSTKASLPSDYQYAATTIVDNKIYVLGGETYYSGCYAASPCRATYYTQPRYNADNTVYVYDISSNKWTSGSITMPISVYGHTSINVNGKIYNIGGYTGSSYSTSNFAYVAKNVTAEEEAEVAVSKAEEFQDSFFINYARTLLSNLSTSSTKSDLISRLNQVDSSISAEVGTWKTSLKEMPVNVKWFDSVTLNGKIYCIGGYTDDYNISNSVQIYDTKTNTWSTGASIPTARYNFAAVAVGKYIYCMGGYTNSGATNSIEIYDAEADKWTTGINLPDKMYSHNAVAVNKKIYVTGGYSGGSLSKTLHIYDVDNNSWSTGANMTSTRYDFGMVEINNIIYCIGGQENSNVHAYNINSNSWSTKAYLPDDYNMAATVNVDDKIYVLGGKYLGVSCRITKCPSITLATYYSQPKNDVYNRVFVYDVSKNSWTTNTITMPIARYSFVGEVVNGSIYCIGGPGGQKTVAYKAKATSPENEAREAVGVAQEYKDIYFISYARLLVNELSESAVKEELNSILSSLTPQMDISKQEPKSSNIDVYIKMENTLSMSLDTNSIIFDKFTGVEDMIKENAVNLTIESSLPYEVSASLEDEIKNMGGTEVVDESILSIKENSDIDYKTFDGVGNPIIILESQASGVVDEYGVDLKLNKNIISKTDVYKTVIKFEVKQK